MEKLVSSDRKFFSVKPLLFFDTIWIYEIVLDNKALRVLKVRGKKVSRISEKHLDHVTRLQTVYNESYREISYKEYIALIL